MGWLLCWNNRFWSFILLTSSVRLRKRLGVQAE
jgi:hypothetical protein